MDTKRCATKNVKVEHSASAIWRPFDSAHSHQPALVDSGGVKSEPATPLSLTFNDQAPPLESPWDLPPPCLPRVFPNREGVGNSSPSDISAPQISPVVSPVPSGGTSTAESVSDGRALSRSPCSDPNILQIPKLRRRRTRRVAENKPTLAVRVEQPDVEKKIGVVQGLRRQNSNIDEKEDCGELHAYSTEHHDAFIHDGLIWNVLFMIHDFRAKIRNKDGKFSNDHRNDKLIEI